MNSTSAPERWSAKFYLKADNDVQRAAIGLTPSHGMPSGGLGSSERPPSTDLGILSSTAGHSNF